LYPWVNGDPLNPGFRVRIPVQLTQGYTTDPIMIRLYTATNNTWQLEQLIEQMGVCLTDEQALVCL